ncbi:MAG: DNA-binding protein [Chitinispirillia bacterium]|nr:DNA-binding protein [Chitinispirillia bacterium]MCL2268883.1 DNA-binding protein [Chitinispirillia bacterium]
MEYTTGAVGRCVCIRLHEGDPVYATIQEVADREGVNAGVVFVIGGVKNGAVVVGPKDQDERPLRTNVENFSDAREIAGVGTLFRNEAGEMKLHMHASIGKGTDPIVGCPRLGLDCWLVTEVIMLELTGVNAVRAKEASGLELLTFLPR